MPEPYLGEIRIFAGNYAPEGWAFCDGQILPVAQNAALFSLFGTTYGGDGQNTFALPDLQGCAPMHWGAGADLTPRRIGETGGDVCARMVPAHLPPHAHTLSANDETAVSATPTGNLTAAFDDDAMRLYAAPTNPPAPFAGQALAMAGSSVPHDNVQPYLGLHFIVALKGMFPNRI